MDATYGTCAGCDSIRQGDPMPGIIYTTTDAAGVKVEWERLQWPPPAKGTHESDLGRNRPHVAFNTSIRWETNSAGHRKHGWMEFYRAGNWSRRA